MGKIDELIKQMCPEGVKTYPLEEVSVDIFSGATPSKAIKAYWEGGTIPWMSSGEVNQGIVTEVEGRITQLGYDKCSTKMVPLNSVVIALAGQGKTRGTVALMKTEACTNQSLAAIVPFEGLNGTFLYHYLKTQYRKLRDISSGDGTRGGLNLKMIRGFEIPLPPLPIQEAIVEILDKFDRLSAELQAELQARKTQYEYYRNQLLTRFAPDQQVKEYSLGELGDIRMCKRILKHQTNSEGGVPFYKIGSFGGDADAYINEELFQEYKSKYSYPKKGDILISAAGTIGKGVIFDGKPSYFQDSNIVWIDNDESKVLNMYLFHLYKIIKWKIDDGGVIKRLYNENIRSAKIQVPSLSEQTRIVSILDKFEALVNDLSQGLPAEIEAVKEQYEYYRNKLLTFDKIS